MAESIDKALGPSLLFLYNTLAVLLGLISPGIGAAAAGSGLAAQAVMDARNRREGRRQDRLVNLVVDLQRRVGTIEKDFSDEEVDLFIEVVEKAVADDEDAKALFYNGILEWILREHPTPAQVRVLSDGVRQLSFVELAAFIREANSLLSRQHLGDELEEQVVWRRLEQAGICPSATVRIHGSCTRLGAVLKKYCGLKDVEMLDRARQNALSKRRAHLS